MASCYTGFELTPPTRHPPAPHKDYSRPLHVDCSVEYELPNQAKPPEGSHLEPLLMIHPCYYRRAESQRRSPFINNLPTTRTSSQAAAVATSNRRAPVARPINQPIQQPQPAPPPPPQQQQQQQYSLRYLDPSMVQQQHQLPQTQTLVTWGQMDPSSVYTTKPSKKDPPVCGGAGDFSSGSDSGVSAGQWTDSDRSPLAPEMRLQRDFQAGTDSGITTPVDDKAILSELLAATCGEVNNNQNTISKEMLSMPVAGGQHKVQHQQPAVGVAAVAASCTGCHPNFVQPHAPAYQRLVQQPWTGVTAVPSVGRPRGARAVEPGPEHAAASLHAHTRRSLPWASKSGGGSAAKRSRTSLAQDAAANQWTAAAQYLPNSTDIPRTGWTSATHVPQPCNGGKDCIAAAAAAAPVCKACIQANGTSTKVETTPQSWSSYYGVGHCRGASEDMSSRVLWNNENMLRLFQV